jgi:triacylglycerol lipase
MRVRVASLLIIITVGAVACAEDASDVADDPTGANTDGVVVDDADDDNTHTDAPVMGSVVDELPTAAAPLGPPYPIVLVHGFSGFSSWMGIEYFFGVADDLRDRGEDVTAPALPPYAPSSERAVVLARVVDEVLSRTGKAKVHIVGHSQGGLDARTLVSEMPAYVSKVATITTISSPFGGSPVADVARYTPDGLINPVGRFLAWVLGAGETEPPSDAAWNDDEDTTTEYDARLAAAIDFLRPSVAAQWQADHPLPEGLPFFSIAGVSNLRSLRNDDCDGAIFSGEGRVDAVDPLLLQAGLVLSYSDGGSLLEPTPNDGLVPVWSARAGTFLGCMPADHFDEMGQIIDVTGGLVSGFDHIDFYRAVVSHAHTVVQAAADASDAPDGP